MSSVTIDTSTIRNVLAIGGVVVAVVLYLNKGPQAAEDLESHILEASQKFDKYEQRLNEAVEREYRRFEMEKKQMEKERRQMRKQGPAPTPQYDNRGYPQPAPRQYPPRY